MNKSRLLEMIEQHHLIVITGTTDGRTYVREIINRNISKKRVVYTRKYPEYIDNQNSVDSYFMRNNTKELYEALMSLIKILERKRLSIVVDSFTDIKSIFRNQVIKDWIHYNYLIKLFINTLQKYNTKLILFVDYDIEQKTHLHKHLLYKSDLIVEVRDNKEIVILKEKTPIIDCAIEE